MAEFNNLLDQKTIMKRSDLTSTEKWVAVVLLSFRNSVDGRCDPPIESADEDTETVCDQTGFTRPCVKKAIDSLQSKGIISVTKRTARPSQITFTLTRNEATRNVVTVNDVTRNEVIPYPKRRYPSPVTSLPQTKKEQRINKEDNKVEDSAKTDTTDSVKTNTIHDKHSVEINTTHNVKNDTTHSVEINTRTSNKNKEIEQVNKKEVEEKEPDDFLLTPVGKPTKRSSLKKPENVTEQTWKDFNAIRKAKKAPLTETALNRIQSEATKAGIDLETALQVCCERGWQGFKADWYTRDNTKTPSPIRQAQPHEPTAEDFTDKQISFFAYKLSRFQPFCSAYGEGFQTYDAFATKIETWLRHPERFKKCLPYLKRLNLVN